MCPTRRRSNVRGVDGYKGVGVCSVTRREDTGEGEGAEPSLTREAQRLHTKPPRRWSSARLPESTGGTPRQWGTSLMRSKKLEGRDATVRSGQ